MYGTAAPGSSRPPSPLAGAAPAVSATTTALPVAPPTPTAAAAALPVAPPAVPSFPPPPPVVHPHGIPPSGQGIAPAHFSHLISDNDNKPLTAIIATTDYTLPPIATDKAITKFTTGLEQLFTSSKATSIQITISN